MLRKASDEHASERTSMCVSERAQAATRPSAGMARPEV
jgi:hypothetical protein